MLTKIDDGLWCLNSHFTTLGCRGSLRMSLIATSAGSIVYSPVDLTPDDLVSIDSLGSVAAILAPNLYHHLYLRPCLAAYPRARVFVPSGLEAKIGPIPGSEVVTMQTVLGPPGEIEHYTFTGHLLRETILYHRPSRTLVTADLLYNYRDEHFAGEKMFFRAIGCYGAPKVAFYHRFAIRDKAGVADLMEAVRRWPIRRIVMCHGRIIEGPNSTQAFLDAWEPFA